jgi:KaiC/GvpD/RAD55 family RecA-like ATPase
MSVQPTPLRRGINAANDPQGDESLLISALLESGQFTPEVLGIEDDHILGWGKLWRFCKDYQAHEHRAPPLEIISHRYRDFVFTPGAGLAYFAKEVRSEAWNRDLRARIAVAARSLSQGDPESAFAQLQGSVPPKTARKEPASVFDASNYDPLDPKMCIPVPWPSLQKAMGGGIGPGELIYIAAYTKEGKSFYLADMAARAAMSGVKVAVIQMEMSSRAFGRRLALRLANGNREFTKILQGRDQGAQLEVIKHLQSQMPGSIAIFDRTHGDVESVLFVREIAGDYGLVVVDNANLMTDEKGRPAEEDHSIQAMVSHSMQKTAQTTGTSLVVATQLNRSSKERGGTRAPGSEFVGGSIGIVRDADCMITFRRRSERVAVMSNTEMREGPVLSWFVRFDPETNRFEEIDKDTAKQLIAADENRKMALD